jgi:ubiquinone/menaquinone biosynthesis C-methylase UbiE
MPLPKKRKRKTEKVKAYFEQAGLYLSDNFNIQFRSEIIRGFLGDSDMDSILDIACGNAEISKQFLKKKNKLTLLDISSNMLSAAYNGIPDDLKENVRTINCDFLQADLPAGGYDLIICTGLLAHIDDPAAALQKIAALSKPGGAIILQNTNSAHFYSYINTCYRFLGTLISSDRYPYNRVSEASILKIFNEKSIVLKNRFCYIQSFLFMDRVIKSRVKHDLLKKVFGSHNRNVRSFLGNDCIYHFGWRG